MVTLRVRIRVMVMVRVSIRDRIRARVLRFTGLRVVACHDQRELQ